LSSRKSCSTGSTKLRRAPAAKEVLGADRPLQEGRSLLQVEGDAAVEAIGIAVAALHLTTPASERPKWRRGAAPGKIELLHHLLAEHRGAVEQVIELRNPLASI